jgi:hypothetical protein
MRTKLVATSFLAALSLSFGAIAADNSSSGGSAGNGDRGGDTMREKSPTTPPTTSAAPVDARTFAAMDANRDGYISRDEAKNAPFLSRFDQLDINHDGKLSQAEIQAGNATAQSMTPGGSSRPQNTY